MCPFNLGRVTACVSLKLSAVTANVSLIFSAVVSQKKKCDRYCSEKVFLEVTWKKKVKNVRFLDKISGSHFKGRVKGHVHGQTLPTDVLLNAALKVRPHALSQFVFVLMLRVMQTVKMKTPCFHWW